MRDHLEAGGTAFVMADSPDGGRLEMREGDQVTPILGVLERRVRPPASDLQQEV